MPGFEAHRGVRFRTTTQLPRTAYGDSSSIFHVTIRVHPKIDRFAEPVSHAIWETVIQNKSRPDITLHAACLMPDHIHLLVQPVVGNVLDFVRDWKRFSTRSSWSHGNRGALWQPGMWDRTVRSYEGLDAVVRYILNNPVRAGLAVEWSDWRWAYARD